MWFSKFIAPLTFVMLTACVTLPTVSQTNQLSPRMTPDEVRLVIGEPAQTQFVANKLIWKYSLEDPSRVGLVPYYLVFDRESQGLEGWYADEAELRREQQFWLEASPPKKTYEVEVKVN